MDDVNVVLEFFGEGDGSLNIGQSAQSFSKIDPGHLRGVDDVTFMDPLEMARQLVFIGFQGFESCDDFPIDHMEVSGVIICF